MCSSDLLLVVVDGSDLDVDHVAHAQDLIGLADAAVGDLADVDEAVNARHDLGKRAEGHELDHLDLGDVADLVGVDELGPGVVLRLLVAEGDALGLLVEADNIDVELVPTETTSAGFLMRLQLSSEM